MTNPSLPWDLKQIKAERARRSLYEFAKQAWEHIEPSVYVDGFHIQAISEHLQAVSDGQIRQLLINIPPRHGKSSLVAVFWPCWDWIDTPSRRWLFSSYAQSLSTRDSVKCRRLILSSWYQGNWGDIYQLAGDQNAKIRFENTKLGYRLATSVEGAATGEGGDIVACDDPHAAQEAESEAVRQSTIDWWDGTMSTRINDPKRSAKVVIMQRLHQLDLSGHLLEQGGWDHLCLPTEYEGRKIFTSIGWSDPRTEEGQLLQPERFGPEQITKAKVELGAYRYAGQYQQRPTPKEGGLIQEAWISYYLDHELPRNPETLSLDFDEIIQSWDCTFKDLKSSDYVVGQVWGRKGADAFLLDQIRDKLSFTKTLDAIRSLSRKWPKAHAKLVEDKANGTAVMDTLRTEIPGLVAVEPKGGKIARVNAITPFLEARNVHLPRQAPFTTDLVIELTTFPNAAHDDQVDALSQALFRLLSKKEPRVRWLNSRTLQTQSTSPVDHPSFNRPFRGLSAWD